MKDECRIVEIDGTKVSVRGVVNHPLTPTDIAALGTLVRAMRAKVAADEPTRDTV